MRAPTKGYVTQVALRPGGMAVSLPLRPVMIFVHQEESYYVAWFRQNSLPADVIFAALCLYLIVGMVWTFIYQLVEVLVPGSIVLKVNADTAASDMFAELLYFSYVTLSTLGYGDIVPLSRLARTMSVIEALLGQIYLAVIVARLIGMQISQQGVAKESGSEEES